MTTWDEASCCDCGAHYLRARVGRPSPRCSNCRAEYRAQAKRLWRESNPGYWRTRHAANPGHQRDRDRARWPLRYGLTREQYDALRAQGRCDICGTDDPGRKGFVIDHDHDCCSGPSGCGQCVRGVLCSNCNTAIGLMKDQPERLLAAARYLQSGRRVVPASIT